MQTTKKLLPLAIAIALGGAGCTVKGDAGINGTNGLNGTNGTNGVNGTTCTVAKLPDGSTRLTCTDGTTAVVNNGINGVAGPTGPAGGVGATGGVGSAGATGATGARGNDGIGATGVTGATGADGMMGATGATGTAGLDGSTGAVGATGATGTAGTNGTNCSVAQNTPLAGQSTITCGANSVVVSAGNCWVNKAVSGARTVVCADNTFYALPDNTIDYTTMTPDEIRLAGIAPAVKSLTIPADGRPEVVVKVSDRRGNGVKGLAMLSTTRAYPSLQVTWSFALLKLVPGSPSALGVNGSANDTWVSYLAASSTKSASTEGASATSSASAGALIDNGDGTYFYKFAKNITAGTALAGTTYDPAAVHRLALLMYQSVSAPSGSVLKTQQAFSPANLVIDFIPNEGTDVLAHDRSGQYDKVDPAACLECHGSLKGIPDSTGVLGSGEFHSGTRYDPRVCVACHNDQRRFNYTLNASGDNVTLTGTATSPTTSNATWTGNLAALNGEAIINIPVFIHKIHMGETLTLNGGNYTGFSAPLEARYPQDIRNCDKCHRNPAPRFPAAKANNWQAAPSRRACNSCHDGITFLASAPGRWVHASPELNNGAGLPLSDDSGCATCHHADDTDLSGKQQHLSILNPDPNATWLGGTSANTNAAYIAAANAIPAAAAKLTYEVKGVTAVTSSVASFWNPQLQFRLLKDGTAVTFNSTASASATMELMPNFVGGPSAYFVYALPQDGIAFPSDFNMSASAAIRNVNNKSVGASTAVMTGPVGTAPNDGWYTITLKSTMLPTSTAMLTGGVGYTYSLGSGSTAPTQPLTQTNLSAYPTAPAIGAPGFLSGGLIVPAPDVWAVASGCATVTQGILPTGPAPSKVCQARRAYTISSSTSTGIVSNEKCNACHEALGVAPTFHAGQRNNAPTCNFCHTPNRTSGGWSANEKDMVHSIHAAGKRTVPYNWHAVTSTENFSAVTYPGILNRCQQCHLDNTYDFSLTVTARDLPNMLPSTVGTGRYDARPATNPTGWFTLPTTTLFEVNDLIVTNSGFLAYLNTGFLTTDLSVDYGYGYKASGTAASTTVTYSLPDAVSGTGTKYTDGTLNWTCSPSAPCLNSSTLGTSTLLVNTDTVTVQGVTSATITQKIGATTFTCNSTTPCTCTSGFPCTVLLAVCMPGSACDAQPTTLVKSPIVSACSGCHDSPLAISHMRETGGTFYEPRSVYATRTEECLTCHGPNRLASIALVHTDLSP